MPLVPELILQLIKINWWSVVYNSRDKELISMGEGMRAPNHAWVVVRIQDNTILWVQLEDSVNQCFLDIKEVTDVFDMVALMIKGWDLCFQVIWDLMWCHGKMTSTEYQWAINNVHCCSCDMFWSIWWGVMGSNLAEQFGKQFFHILLQSAVISSPTKRIAGKSQWGRAAWIYFTLWRAWVFTTKKSSSACTITLHVFPVSSCSCLTSSCPIAWQFTRKQSCWRFAEQIIS